MPNIANFGEGYHIHVTGLIHDETGFPVGSPTVTENAIRRLHEKIYRAVDEIVQVEELFMDDAEYAVIAYGGTARTAYEAVYSARERGLKIGMLRLITIWPFADKAVYELASRMKGILTVELNYGQLVNEVRRAANGKCPVELCAKYNMQIFEPEEIEEAIDRMVAKIGGGQ